MMDDVTFITKVRDLLADRKRWTHHTTARNSNNEPCDIASGTKFCWTGGCYHVLFADEPSLAIDIRIETAAEMCAKITRVFEPIVSCTVAEILGENPVIAGMVTVNDHQGHAEVMDLIEQALSYHRRAARVRALLAADEMAPLESGRPMAPA